jgi:hypothetical protein
LGLRSKVNDPSRRGVSFLAGHGVADHEHTADLTSVIGEHIRAPQDIDDVNHVADVVADLYVRIFHQISAGANT